MLSELNKALQNALVNTMSLSETIDLRSPWSLTTMSRNIEATVVVLNGCFRG
jgi:hypothetical protein